MLRDGTNKKGDNVYKGFCLLGLLLTSLSAFAVENGEPVSVRVHHSIVNIVHENGACSGVVVADQAILSAAHCRDRFGLPKLVAFIQPDVKTQSCDIAEVETSLYAPGAEPSLPLNVHGPDILLIKMKSSLCSVSAVQMSQTPLNEGANVWQAGHGGGSGTFALPHQVELEVIGPQLATELTTPRNKIEARLLEKAPQFYLFALPLKEKASVCHGDSGGPTFVESEGQVFLYGVNGAVLPNEQLGSKCSQAYVHLITPLAPYKNWIDQTLAEWNSIGN